MQQATKLASNVIQQAEEYVFAMLLCACPKFNTQQYSPDKKYWIFPELATVIKFSLKGLS